MESINVRCYKNDEMSNYVYLGAARVKAVEIQPTERREYGLLDLVFEVPLEGREPAEFLIRLETFSAQVVELRDKIHFAINHPRPHPWSDDLFSKAVTGMTPREQHETILREFLEKKS